MVNVRPRQGDEQERWSPQYITPNLEVIIQRTKVSIFAAGGKKHHLLLCINHYSDQTHQPHKEARSGIGEEQSYCVFRTDGVAGYD